MLADAVVSLGYLASRPLLQRLTKAGASFHQRWQNGDTSLNQLLPPRHQGYTTLSLQEDDIPPPTPSSDHQELEQDQQQHQQSISHLLAEADQDDAPASQLISTRTVIIGLALSIAFCVLCIHIVFGDLVPLYATVSAVLMALVLSIMGVRALGETDLNPVSGISKLAQLFFALIVPQSHPTSVLINLVAGAVSEAGALQAGDLMQDLKTGHLLGAAPKAQFWGQVVGATVGAVVSAFIYRLYTAVYTIPGSLFQVPTAYVWIFTARLVTGQGLPYMAREWAIAFAVLFTLSTMVRIYATNKRWQHFVPGGIAVAVGMYNGMYQLLLFCPIHPVVELLGSATLVGVTWLTDCSAQLHTGKNSGRVGSLVVEEEGHEGRHTVDCARIGLHSWGGILEYCQLDYGECGCATSVRRGVVKFVVF